MKPVEEQLEYLFAGNENIEILPSKEVLIEKLKKDKPLRIKLGIDPTSADLHLGHTVCLQLLKRFQDLGHTPVLLIGGFTAQLGDPTGRNETRPPLTTEDVTKNAQTYIDQVTKILDINKIEIVNNIDWLDKLNLKDIIKLLSLSTVNQLIAKDAFGKRINDGHALYMHELLYPILQGYDSVAINADVELGGTDQRFNILTGRDLQKAHEQSQQVAIMLPLLVGLDGQKKMSKTYNNSVGINDAPNEMYGKTMSVPDELLYEWYSLALSLQPDELKIIKSQLETRSINPRDLKMQLARYIVELYHGINAVQSAEQDFITKFQKRDIPEDIEEYSEYSTCENLAELLVNSKLAPSKGEAKRKLKEGAVKLNSNKIDDSLNISDLKSGDILQLGKRKFIKLVTS